MFSLDRRGFVKSAVAAALGGTLLSSCSTAPKDAASRPAAPSGYPGPFPGRVVEVRHPGAVKGQAVDRDALRDMVSRGLMELAGAPDAASAWRFFFQPGEVVGLKVNPVGAPRAITHHELVHEVVQGLKSAGVAPRDILVFDRYRAQMLKAGYVKNLPEGLRWEASSEDYDNVQLDIAGYDPEVFCEMDLISPGHHDPKDPRARRSHLSLIVSRRVQKIINLPVLKDHASAGVTLALKNMSHGFVNNVARSHATHGMNVCNYFIPAICSMPQVRAKVVLHLLDGLRGVFDGGPDAAMGKVWTHNTLYFATDPVAMDRIGWETVDRKRLSVGLSPVAEARFRAPADEEQHRSNSFQQPQHIEIAGALGLGVFDRDRIDHRQIAL
ncbi:MAG: DUF362 domain-containing protein [Planctomycetes bacterium]|nr:DUF362 domain-containing protein [Planctomycetota bacterium]